MTHDASLVSWVPVPEGSDFPVQNLPYGMFRFRDDLNAGVAIGDQILSLSALERDGHMDNLGLDGTFATSTLNAFMACDPSVWSAVRGRLSAILVDGDPDSFGRYLVAAADVAMVLPVEVGDYVDFYSSKQHATNLGRMFRPDSEALLPNWKHIPIGYNGRSSTVVVSGTSFPRPMGQRRGPESPVFGQSERLDIELEVGFLTGGSGVMGDRIDVAAAEDRIFGMCLVNDWSARDIQAWEYVPLGPFQGKTFATSMSPWIVTLEALAPFRTPPPPQDPAPLPYLQTSGDTAVNIDLEVELNGSIVARVPFATSMYWTMAQQLAHASLNGMTIRPGDLFASGTVSGDTPDAYGSLIEMSWNGTEPITLDNGTTRTFLEDGDTVVLRGRCHQNGFRSIGFGEVVGTVLPATG